MDTNAVKLYLEEHADDHSKLDTIVGVCAGYTAFCASRKVINAIAPKKSPIQAFGCLAMEVIFGVEVGTICNTKAHKIRLACQYVIGEEEKQNVEC